MKATAYHQISLLQGLTVTFAFSASPQFSFPIAFEDAAGNRDTVIFGYDSMATDSIDASFSEINIMDQPFDSLFEVRVSVLPMDGQNSPLGRFHSKTQITSNICEAYSYQHSFILYTRNWPVMASWDSSLFTGACPYGGGMTGFNTDAATHTSLHNASFSKMKQVTITSHGGDIRMPFRIEADIAGGRRDTVERFLLTLSDRVLYESGLAITFQNGSQREYSKPKKNRLSLEKPGRRRLYRDAWDLLGKWNLP